MSASTAPPAPTETSTATPSLGEVFRNPNFAKFWVAQVVSYLGDRIDQMAMTALVIAAASAAEKGERASQIVFFGALPYLLISPFIGALIDRVDRRRLLVLMDIVRAIIILGVVFLVNAESHPGVVYTVVFLIGCCTAVFAPTKSAFIPEIVPPNHLLRANSVSATMGSLMTLIGTPVGAALVKQYGYKTSLFIDSATYLFSMVMLLWIVRPRGAATDISHRKEELRHEGGYLRNLLDGLRFVFKSRVPGTCVMMDSAFFLVAGVVFTAVNSIVYDRLAPKTGNAVADGAESVWIAGMIFGVLGLGLFAGSVSAGRLFGGIRMGKVVASCFAGTALFLLLLRVHMSVQLTSLVVFLLAFSAGGIIVCLETALQKSVPDEMRGRVFALNSFLLNFFLLAAIQGTILLTKKGSGVTTIEGMLIFAAVLALVAGTVSYLRFPRDLSIRSMKTLDAHPQGG